MSSVSPPLYSPANSIDRAGSRGSHGSSSGEGIGITTRLLLTISIILTLVTGIVLLLVWMVGAELSRAGHSTDTSLRQIEIGNDVLAIPVNHIRFRSQRRNGVAGRTDLYFHWPKMSGFSEQLESEFNSETVNPAIIFVKLEPRPMTKDMSGRIDPIYRKFFVNEPMPAPGGLLKQNLSASSGYAGEYIAYERDSDRPFVARCVEGSQTGATEYCITDFHIGRNISVTYRFHVELLDQWMPLDLAIRTGINSMIVQ
ncbi:MAG: hypothetical protein ACR2O0_13120 [Rhizobiaceae bacterium]